MTQSLNINFILCIINRITNRCDHVVTEEWSRAMLDVKYVQYIYLLIHFVARKYVTYKSDW